MKSPWAWEGDDRIGRPLPSLDDEIAELRETLAKVRSSSQPEAEKVRTAEAVEMHVRRLEALR